MLKGVNRQVIEVSDTDSRYYERAWFLVRERCECRDEKELLRCARAILHCADTPSGIKKRSHRLRSWMRVLLPAVVGSALTLLIVFLF